MSSKIHPIILSGGSGQRLWPVSRERAPKQLAPLLGEHSLLVATARRVTGDAFAAPIIVCNQDHRLLVAEQLAAVGIRPSAVITEPVARNTAPAIAAAAAFLARSDPDAVMLVLPSDHVIGDEPGFIRAIAIAARAAETGYLVTFGAVPTAPETGYGYIRRGDALAGAKGAFTIERFVEKPDLATALDYLADSDWSWNCGMFVFPVGLMLGELGRFEPDMVRLATQSVDAAAMDGDIIALSAGPFTAIISKSIDYALMERTDRAAIVPANLGWSDVGSWSALWEIGDKDAAGNVAIGDVMTRDVRGSYIRSHGPLIAALGLDDVILVATGDVVLAAARTRAQDVRAVVSRLRADGRSEATSPVVVHHPWGVDRTIDSGPCHRVKRITVNPGGGLSFRKHSNRAGHWVVVKGVARMTRDEEVLTLDCNMSIDIPPGSLHRLENPGSEPLELLEVQSGSDLGEDDIVQSSDDHGRE